LPRARGGPERIGQVGEINGGFQVSLGLGLEPEELQPDPRQGRLAGLGPEGCDGEAERHQVGGIAGRGLRQALERVRLLAGDGKAGAKELRLLPGRQRLEEGEEPLMVLRAERVRHVRPAAQGGQAVQLQR
jgi:hypothetical protein